MMTTTDNLTQHVSLNLPSDTFDGPLPHTEADTYECPRCIAERAVVAVQLEQTGKMHILFDGPPSHESGRFVEVEDGEGRSFNAGEWVKRDDGLWALIIDPKFLNQSKEA
jgi:hypothetical protein